MRTKWIAMLVGVVMVVPTLASAQTEWVDDPVMPVLGPAEPGAWDEGARYPMAVIQVDGIYHLFYNGQPEGVVEFEAADVGHATSTDGVSWELDPTNPVLTRGAAGQWDDNALWGVAIVHDESGFRMWFSGFDSDDVSGRAGYATSEDGSAWTKHAGNPIMDVGTSGTFDDQAVIPGNGECARPSGLVAAVNFERRICNEPKSENILPYPTETSGSTGTTNRIGAW